MNYSFETINDKEFEILAIDIISRYFDTRIERFKEGKDHGVDGRYYKPEHDEIVIQCKHYFKSGFKQLYQKLKSTEINSIQKLNPKRYILITSVPLSRQNKLELFKLLSPFLKSESDIFGNEDLNDLLSKYSDIEKKHFKLWISSTTVLQTILNNSITGRSLNKLQEIYQSVPKYAETKDHYKALKKLAETRVLILTGVAGIGKTTLADQISLHFVKMGYEYVYIDHAINEAESVFFEDKRQIFYFDDFLGRNYLEALERKEDSRIINFINRVRRSEDKIFILTSRTAILKQGKELSDLFHIDNIGKNEYELRINNYSLMDKAKILYNHIWYSLLDSDFITELYNNLRYLQIIKHKNFNPRLISFITDSHRVQNVKKELYWNYIQKMLNNPKYIWEDVFNLQLDEISRFIPYLITFNGGDIGEINLRSAFFRLTYLEKLVGMITSDTNYEKTIRITTGTVINRTIGGFEIVKYELYNPSVTDYVLERLRYNSKLLINLFRSLHTVASIHTLFNLYSSGKIDSKTINLVLDELIKDCDIKSEIDYTAFLYSMAIQKGFTALFNNKSSKITIEEMCREDIRDLYNKLVIMSFAIDQNIITGAGKVDLEFYERFIEECEALDDLNVLVKILRKIYIHDMEKYWENIKNKIYEIYSNNITEIVLDSDVLIDFRDEEDIDDAIQNVTKFIEEEIQILGIDFGIDKIKKLVSKCNYEDILEKNMIYRAQDELFNDNNLDETMDYSEANIIDLFERT
ncbi:restriction endonuclease [Leptospira stimsonii]|uniref:Restriction endonuclease type IV Mrr domain-containing protein n=1 Tax=Leptospira stimsonii TaxID=2202203 RepID=A0A8B3CKQ6_9LEPT|nr:restriction endonuclease [Leptospira stimsonii]RHX83209.1 hypothetical protein DLM78_22130 [Leptospira stimsonii]